MNFNSQPARKTAGARKGGTSLDIKTYPGNMTLAELAESLDISCEYDRFYFQQDADGVYLAGIDEESSELVPMETVDLRRD